MTEFENKFNKAEQYFKEKKYLHALQIYQSLLDVTSYQRKSVVKLVEIFDIQKQQDQAINTFEQYLSKNPDDENMRMYLAQFLIRHQRYSEANDALSGISTFARPEKNFLMGLANLYTNDYDIAAINIIEFIEKNSKSDLLAEAYLYLAKCCINMDELEKALINLKKSEELNGGNFKVYYALAKIYYEKEMYFHALENIQKSLKLNPVDLESIELSGKIFYKLGEYKKAIKEFKQLVEKGNMDSEVFALLGHSFLKENDIYSANSYFKSALDLNPLNETAQKGLAQCKVIDK